MSAAFEKFLAGLPAPFDVDPHPTPAIRIHSTVNTTVLVGNSVLQQEQAQERVLFWTYLVDPFVREISLRHATLNDALAAMASDGLAVTMLRPDLGERSARLLLDQPLNSSASGDFDLCVATSPLYTVLLPMVEALEDRDWGITNALEQLQLLTASGHWADLWGRWLNIPRKPNEDDATYTARMKAWTIRARTNNKALEEILKDDLGLEGVVIDDLLPLVLIWNETVYHSWWPGNIYNSGAFRVSFVQTTGISADAVKKLLDLHKAAGTRYLLAIEEQHTAALPVSATVVQGADFTWDGQQLGMLLRAQAQVDTPRLAPFAAGEVTAALATGGTPGGPATVEYMVVPRNAYGETEGGVATASLAPGGGDDLVDLTWLARVGATGYRIYRQDAGAGGFGFVTEVGTVTTYQDEPAVDTRDLARLAGAANQTMAPTEILLPKRPGWVPGTSGMPGSVP